MRELGFPQRPDRPAFNAQGPAAITYPGVQLWRSLTVDNCKSFNMATGQYTAPCDGMYCLHAHVFPAGRLLIAPGTMFQFRKNGSSLGNAAFIGVTQSVTVSSSLIVKAVTGDKFDLFVLSALTSEDAPSSAFSGFMVG